MVLLPHSILSIFLNILHHGEVIYTTDPREEALNAVLDTNDSDPHLLISANDLQVESRLILNIVHRILFPKSGAFKYISERDLAIKPSYSSMESIKTSSLKWPYPTPLLFIYLFIIIIIINLFFSLFVWEGRLAEPLKDLLS